MTFRVTARLASRIVSAEMPRAQRGEFAARLLVQRQAFCVACAWYLQARCEHPGCGCQARRDGEPWRRIPRCPQRLW